MNPGKNVTSTREVIKRSSQWSITRKSYTLYLSLILTPFFFYFAFVAQNPITRYLDVLLTVLCLTNAIIVWSDSQRFFNVVPTIVAFLGCTVALYVLYLGTDSGSTMLWIYITPVLIFVLGGYLGITVTLFVLLAGTWLLANAGSYGGYDYPPDFVWRFASSFSILTAMMVGFEYWRVAGELERERLTEELNQTIVERDAYANLASVCAWCRKVRDEEQNWLTLESYLQRQDQLVSHAICPECSKEQLNNHS